MFRCVFHHTHSINKLIISSETKSVFFLRFPFSCLGFLKTNRSKNLMRVKSCRGSPEYWMDSPCGQKTLPIKIQQVYRGTEIPSACHKHQLRRQIQQLFVSVWRNDSTSDVKDVKFYLQERFCKQRHWRVEVHGELQRHKHGKHYRDAETV